MQSWIDLLLAVFFPKESGFYRNLSLHGDAAIRRQLSLIWFPSFTEKLTLCFYGHRERSTRFMDDEIIARLREEVISSCSNPDLLVPNGSQTCWRWNLNNTDYDPTFLLCTSGYQTSRAPFTPWILCPGGHESILYTARGYGTLCYLKASVKEKILTFSSIIRIIAQLSRWCPTLATNPRPPMANSFSLPDHYRYTTAVNYFLGVFSGKWPSRNERVAFSLMYDTLQSTEKFHRCFLQVHFRCFDAITSLEGSVETSGLKCNRERGRIDSSTLDNALYFFEERRISIFGLLSSHRHAWLTPCEGCPPAFYSVFILQDFDISTDKSWDFEWSEGLEGTIAFHSAVFTSVSLWQKKWNDVLDGIDEHLRVRLEDTMHQQIINNWMFDNGFGRSRLYVTVLHVLRIFGEYIRTVSDDLRSLDDIFLEDDRFPMPDMRPEELRIMRSNWKSIKEFQNRAEENLLGRISQKTEEVKSLRDGLFNATSLREANLSSREARRSAVMGRYILVFTIVTIMYLPPSFVSSVFDLDIFQKDVTQTKWEYKVAIVSVSLLTYLTAFASIIAVDWEGFKKRFTSWWRLVANPSVASEERGPLKDENELDKMHTSDEDTSREGNTTSGSSSLPNGMQAAHTKIRLDTEPNKAGPTGLPKDLEKGVS
ncbi:hypothetical protein F4680DRAFT_304494 [Xylaria scruposa]|nr:hypothetical protein F4680DRAFT_304494 [Xylaria scruposa]